jgi:hypothetical protein
MKSGVFSAVPHLAYTGSITLAEANGQGEFPSVEVGLVPECSKSFPRRLCPGVWPWPGDGRQRQKWSCLGRLQVLSPPLSN